MFILLLLLTLTRPFQLNSLDDREQTEELRAWQVIEDTAKSPSLLHKKMGLFAAHLTQSAKTIALLDEALSSTSLELQQLAIDLCAYWPDIYLQKRLIQVYKTSSYRRLQSATLQSLSQNPHPLLLDFYTNLYTNNSKSSLAYCVGLCSLIAIQETPSEKYILELLNSNNPYLEKIQWSLVFDHYDPKQVLNLLKDKPIPPSTLLSNKHFTEQLPQYVSKIEYKKLEKLDEMDIYAFLSSRFGSQDSTPLKSDSPLMSCFAGVNGKKIDINTKDPSLEIFACNINYALGSSLYSECKENCQQTLHLALQDRRLKKLSLCIAGPFYYLHPLYGPDISQQIEVDQMKLLIACTLLELDLNDTAAIASLLEASQSLIENTSLTSFSLLLNKGLIDILKIQELAASLPLIKRVNIDLLLSILKKDETYLKQHLSSFDSLTHGQKEKLLYAMIQNPSKEYIELLSNLSPQTSVLLENLRSAAILRAIKS